ncbi:ABC transporter permease subunit [Planotetraspora sp. GP83]|uniref:ABC transporter permease subunit n=1 Tax=Planotetraspora sp. GP83 TaxID=3156264 RepID=UPI003518C60F
MSRTSPRAVLTAEWTKIRTVRSTVWTLLPTLVLSVGLGFLVGLSFRNGFSHMSREQQETFDPLFATFYSLTLGQLALVVFGVLVMSSEYSSGSIRASLAAVPRRGLFYGCKLLAATLPVLGVSLVTVLATFYTAQAALGPHRTPPGSDGAPQAIVGACLYLTLISLFATGVAAMSRSSVRSLAILLPLLFLGSQGLGNVPKVKTVAQYLPDQAGMVIMHLAGPPGDPRFARPYGPWTGLGIVALWTAASLIGGYLVLRRRDA